MDPKPPIKERAWTVRLLIAMHDLRAVATQTMRLAQKRGLTLITVESCTAGALACALSEIEGAAETLHGSFVVYTKLNKTAALAIPGELIAAHSAVSAPVAEAMARSGLERTSADIAMAITGVAGPEPDEDGNPVGLAYVAAAIRDGRSLVERLHLSGPRHEICSSAMVAALRLADRLME
jgi:nicotinamide-nucleotide amidase